MSKNPAKIPTPRQNPLFSQKLPAPETAAVKIPTPSENPLFSQKLPAPETAAAKIPTPSENPLFSQNPAAAAKIPTPSENPLFSQNPAAGANLLRAEGFDFAFDASACERCGGACCVGESGYIFTTPAEREELAKACGIALCDFEERYTFRVGARRSLIEKPDGAGGAACVFFDLERRCCSVYAARPQQCRSFPFWRGFSAKELCKECIGVIY